MAAQDVQPPVSPGAGRAFPAARLMCGVTTPDNVTFTVAIKAKADSATLKSSREDLFPSGGFTVAPALITRRSGGDAVDYRVSLSSDRPTGRFSLGMNVEGGVVTKSWLRMMPPGPFRSDRSRELGSARCTAEKKS
ncbi:MAG: hypothetical protein KF783_08590 [Sphingomonas sp.]|nr:hypothetical protein [Sphingomonas sp.]